MREKVKLPRSIKIKTVTSGDLSWGGKEETFVYETNEVELEIKVFSQAPPNLAQTPNERGEVFMNHGDHVLIYALKEFLRQAKAKRSSH